MIPWALESWANYEIEIYSDIEDPEKVANKESAIVVLNHPGDLDWMIGWVVINRIGMLGVRQHSVYNVVCKLKETKQQPAT